MWAPKGENTSVAPGQGRIGVLDGWRGVSIAVVIAIHLVNWRFSPKAAVEQAFALAAILAEAGVDIFFIVSGFIITRRALDDQRSAVGFRWGAFYLRRALRIVPPFFIYLTAVAILEKSGHIERTRELRAALFMCNLPTVACDWFVAHSWTLAYEEQFYWVFPFVLALRARCKRSLFMAFALAVVALPFARVALHGGEFWRQAAFFAQPFVFLCAGGALAEHHSKVQQIMLNYGRHLYAGAAIAGFALSLWLLAQPWSGALAYVQAIVRMTCLPALLTYFVAHSLHRPTGWQRFLQRRALRFVGGMSYSLYIWQQLFTGHPSHYLINGWLLIPPLLLLCAAASYYVVERPCGRVAQRWFAGRLTRPLAPTGQT